MRLVDGVLGTCLCLICLLVWTFITNIEITLIGAAPRLIGFLVLSGMTGSVSALLVVIAMKKAPASVVAPLGYVEIVSAAIIGYLIFKETVGFTTIIGCIIILGMSWLSGRIETNKPQS